jgi:prepilin-type N-terminal cleavage/methylation domain-containing protein/prepilin-type processing-associated H-X9-DG protein
MKKAFTLIELLVVIAIIAILAAILFPVFAQAKSAAKASADLSNMKQNALAALMYSNDSDDQFPYSFSGNWSNYPLETWPQIIQPYTKSYDIFRSPFDTNKLVSSSEYSNPSWMGVALSYGANGAVIWDSTQSANVCDGPLTYMAASSWASGCSSMSQTQINQIAGTILFADRFSSDEQKLGYVGNASGFPGGNIFVQSVANGGCTTASDCTWYNGLFPDSTVSTANAFPYGPDGGVSIANANKSNFAFTDGHVKSMQPRATNPSTFNNVANDMWDAKR